MKPVEVRSLSYSVAGVPILEDIHLEVSEAEFVGLIGPNGAGKTTLLQILLGLVRGWEGYVRVFGRDPRELGSDRHLIAYIPQDPHGTPDFPATAEDVVLMGRVAVRGLFRRLTADDRDLARKMLQSVGMLEHAKRPIGDLSGGQRQRVLIARALASQAKLLILDEPTTGVDRAAEEAFFDLLDALKRERAMSIIMASHDLTMVSRHCDTVACLNRRMYCHSRPEELDHARIAEMFGTHVEFFIHGDIPHRVVHKHEPAPPGQGPHREA